ncbi:class I SAM-dependent methyltransferase [Lysinibacillus sphaericus]|nr:MULTISPECIES: class I SAM-dependent methyltransferase [Lysinibacillus]ACA39881.1 methyltransferase [Lysinibacillus sphaericus C3-41]MBE5082326.1 class I SAM-dependent methyltransferase [Bacillus thuringiensis]QPA52134.1 class I SAM-dependent methyltransferase [Lysinibacillus sphaericus]QTB20317.1 class I SAM-dependent methyltransferase [Lysinibacillus sphaericus]QTB28647.1 class I SAM-dependent methyltransferase [Lysinibacillus sphaericus]
MKKKVVFIQDSNYLQFLAKFGVGGAHPGGINLSKEILKNESILPTSHILDVGCGTGQTAAFLASYYTTNVTGIDINPIMIEKARHRMKKARLPVNIIQGSIEETSLPNGAFDFVLAESVLSFVHKQRALQEIFRLLKQGGRLIAIEFTIPTLLSSQLADDIQQFYGFDALFTKKDWVALFQEIGFQDIRIQKNKDISSKPEFHISKEIESTLYDVLDQHIMMNEKYDNILDYRIYICTK